MTMRQRAQRTGVLYILLAVLGYSFFPILTKKILGAGLAPLDLALWRFVFAAPAFWLIIAALRLSVPEIPLPRYRLLLMGTLLAIAALTAILGLSSPIPASTYVVLFYTYPAMVALMSAIMGEPLSMTGWVALVMTLIGIGLTVPDFGQGLSSASVGGILLALINAAVVAVYFILNNRLLRPYTSPAYLARASAWAVNGALVVMLGIGLTRAVKTPATIDIWVALVVVSLFCTVMPVFALTNGIQRLGPARASIMGTVEPVLTLIWSLLFLNEGEQLKVVQFIGAAFIIGSVVLLQVPQLLRRPRTFQAEVSMGAD
jgi:drug/metabolite transporter (DMT)-like permease